MNKKDLIIAYILTFICIIGGLTLHYPTPYHFPFMVACMFLFPLVISKTAYKKHLFSLNNMDKSFINNKFLAFVIYYPATIFNIIVTIMAFFAVLLNCYDENQFINKTCDNCRITTVKTLEKAKEIQTYLAKQDCLTEHDTVFDINGEIIGYKIKLKSDMKKNEYYNVMSDLLDTSIIDASVESPINSTYYKIKLVKSTKDNGKKLKFKVYSPNKFSL